jgi:hypothetical protein
VPEIIGAVKIASSSNDIISKETALERELQQGIELPGTVAERKSFVVWIDSMVLGWYGTYGTPALMMESRWSLAPMALVHVYAYFVSMLTL